MLFHHIAAWIALTCFLTSTTGLNLVEHYCSLKDKSFVFWFDQNPTCADHRCAPKADAEACCKHECSPDCCQNFNLFIKLDEYLLAHHDVKNISCPIFIVNRSFNIENLCHSSCECRFSDGFSDDIGLPKHLLIKRITELLL